ncbi:MAG: hypothetical protein KDB60_12915 [Propionibacteriaceae bacterium]|nr:hypothetical protein [Propionibacteriaceae bacterium]
MLRMALSVALLVTGCNPIWIDQDDNSVSLWQLIGAITDGLGVLVGGGVLLALVVLLAAVLTPTGRLGRNRQVFTVAVLFCLSLGLVVLAAQGADQQFEGMQANYLTCLLLAAATGVAWIPRDTVDGG